MAPESARHEVNETQPERIDREEEVAHTVRGEWHRDLVLVAALLVALLSVGWWHSGRFADNLRNAAVSGCERQNEVRQAIRTSHTDDIRAEQATDHRDYPNMTIERFRNLKGERITTLRRQRASVPDADCEAAYPG